MSHISLVMRKEMREMLSPGTVASILIMVILFAGIGTMIGGEVEKASVLPTFGLVADDGSYYDYEYEQDGTTVRGSWDPYDSLSVIYGKDIDKVRLIGPASMTESEIVSAMESEGLDAVLIFPSIQDFDAAMESHTRIGLGQYYIYHPSGMFGSVTSTVLSSVVSMMNQDLSEILTAEYGITDYAFFVSPMTIPSNGTVTVINGQAYTGVTPGDVSSAVSGQTMMIPIVIMIVIIMIGSIVISSIGSEKENKTLETLLTLPIKRSSIVTGKLLAAAAVGLVYGLAYMVGMSIYMGSMTGMLIDALGDVDLDTLGMSLNVVDWVLVMLSMFLAIICALGICMILGAFAKNYKSAQTMTMPLSILSMIPMFVILFTGWYGAGAALQGICFAIPFSHPMMAMQALMNGDTMLVVGGVVYNAIFAFATVLITVRLYRSDILITGLGQNKYVQKFTGRT